MSEFKHTISREPVGVASGSPSPDLNNSASGLATQSLTINNAAVISIAAMSGKQVISTVYGATIDQIGNARLEETLSKIGKGVTYLGIAAINPYAAAGKVAVDAISRGVERAVYIQDTNLENEYKRATRGVATSLGGYYG